MFVRHGTLRVALPNSYLLLSIDCKLALSTFQFANLELREHLKGIEMVGGGMIGTSIW